VHFRLSAQFSHTQAKSAPVDPDGLPESLITLENRAKFEGEYGGGTEAVRDDSGVLNGRFLVQIAKRVVIFADDHGKFTAGITQDSCAVHSLNTF
jgi:hypothetical protein